MFLTEMNDLEHHPAFDPSIRIKDVDKEKKATEREISPVASEAPFDDRNTDDALGLSIFQEESTEKPKGLLKVRFLRIFCPELSKFGSFIIIISVRASKVSKQNAAAMIDI